MKTAGYSGTPLAAKLGIREHYRISLRHPPAHYFDLFSDMPANIRIVEDRNARKDFIHYFATSADMLAKDIKGLKGELEQDGMLWISWYKKSAKMPTDITEDVIRNIALKNGLVDIKVCAVDELWSGLKLVIPVKDRK